MAKEGNPTDKLVGDNIRLKRVCLGLSQANVAEELGITAQQVQKYEKGKNRVGASRLEQIAKILKVTPTFFFQDLQTAGKSEQEQNWAYDPDLKRMISFLDGPEGKRLVANFMRITDPAMRSRILELLVGIADAQSPSVESRSDDGPAHPEPDPT